jgi:hypothetical protein
MKLQQIVYLFFLIFINNIQITISNTSEPDYYRYLQQFGYAPKADGRRLLSVVGKSSYNEGIRRFQRLYKLPVSYFIQSIKIVIFKHV